MKINEFGNGIDIGTFPNFLLAMYISRLGENLLKLLKIMNFKSNDFMFILVNI